jgi:hypothetical protein
VLGPLRSANLNHCIQRESNTVGVSLRSPEDGNRSSFRNVVFYSYLEFRTMDKAHKLSNSECYTQLSEPFKLYMQFISIILKKLVSN